MPALQSSHSQISRLAWRTTGGGRSVESFDPMVLHQSFEQTIRDLKVLNEKMKRKSEKLEAQVWFVRQMEDEFYSLNSYKFLTDVGIWGLK